MTPGTVCEYKKALNDQLGNQQVEVLFQPEFLRASSAYDDVMNPWYVVIGTHGGTEPPTGSLRHLPGLYGRVEDQDYVGRGGRASQDLPQLIQRMQDQLLQPMQPPL